MRRRGWASPGQSSTELGAARIAAKAFGVPLASLRVTSRLKTATLRKYRYVFWVASRGMWVVVRKGHSSVGLWADSQEGAAKLAAQAIGCPASSLLLVPKASSQPACRPKRRYRWVVWDVRRKKWRVCRKGSCGLQPRYDTEEEAARAASRMFKTPLTKLKLVVPERLLANESVEILRLRFRQLMALYCTSKPNDPVIPGDLSDLISRRNLWRQMPGLLVPIMLCKYGPHRDALVRAARQTTTRLREAAEQLHAVLEQTVLNLSDQRLSGAWLQNVGRKNCHHSGLVMFLQKGLGMLKPLKAVGGGASVQGAVRLGLKKRPFKVVALHPNLKCKLQTLDRLGQALLGIKSPTNIVEWQSEVSSLQNVLRGPPKVAGFTGGIHSYRALWVIRCFLIWQMRCAGVPRLRVSASCTVKQFAASFPDQRRWMMRLAGPRNLSMPAIDLFKDCNYRGPPELFSMYTCLFGDADLVAFLQRMPKGWLTTHHSAIVKVPPPPLHQTPCTLDNCWWQVCRGGGLFSAGTLAHSSLQKVADQVRLEYEQLHGMPPHPAVLVARAARLLRAPS